MTVTPDPNQPPDEPPDQPPDQPHEPPHRPIDDQPQDDAVTSETAAPEPSPTEAPDAGGPAVAVETTTTAAAHTVASPSPIPDYALEPSGERPAATPDADADDSEPTRRYPVDAGLTVPLTVPFTPRPTPPLPPDPPGLAPEPPYPAPEPMYPVAPGPVSRAAAEPARPEASVRPRRRPLFGTIVWGVILFALAGYVLLGVLVPAPADPTLWLLGGVIVIGLLLIVVGVIAALRRAG